MQSHSLSLTLSHPLSSFTLLSFILQAFAELAKKKMPNGKSFGGRYYSLTPGRKDSISDEEHKKLIKVRGGG